MDEEGNVRAEKYISLCVQFFRCFKAGDERVNEHIGLAALHTMWLREHNRIARELSLVNPHWSDEVLFQEARRVVIAEFQHITYNEYLPVVLGQSVVTDYGLLSQSSGFYNAYDINTNVGVLNAVGAAALWFFASLMPKTMSLYDTVWLYFFHSYDDDNSDYHYCFKLNILLSECDMFWNCIATALFNIELEESRR